MNPPLAAAFSAEDHRHMARALQLAARGMNSTRPNPRVGCVLVRDDRVVGEGWHVRAGEPHAEVHALAQAGELARGARCYVTLEPCCHRGRTPPCSDALLQAGVSAVIAAMPDPNPRVAGGGLRQLASAGLRVDSGLMAAAAEALNIGFCQRMRTGRPWVRVKLGTSLDGRVAMASGESQWITGEAARADVQRWRARSCAIVTGIGTVLADDPSLTVRAADLVAELPSQPLRVVLDSHGRMPADARVATAAGGCLQLVGDGVVSRPPHGEVIACPRTAGGIDLDFALQRLGERGVNEVLVESGPTLAGALLRAGLADELICYVAPRLLGDAAQPMLRLPGLARLADAPTLTLFDVRVFGDDLRLTLRPVRHGPAHD